MKRKFLSTALLGLALLAPAVTTVSCSDYDDDINNVQKQVDDLKALAATKTELETEIASLKTQLEAKDGELQTAIDALKAKDTELQTLIGTKADRTTVDALQAEVDALETEVSGNRASIAALETRISTAESALESLSTLITDLQNNKVDKTTYNEEVTKIYAAIAAVDTKVAANLTSIEALQKGLEEEAAARKAVADDLAEQIAALDKIEALYDDDTKVSELKSSIADLKEKLETLKSEVESNDTDINTIKENLQNVNNDVQSLEKELKAEIAVLNVFVKQELRSLVFRPDAYYWGVEAARLFYLENGSYKLDATAYDNKETVAYDEDVDIMEEGLRTDHALYASDGEFTNVINTIACYHMNPSSANLEGASVSVLSDDKAFIRAAECGLSVKDWKTEEGMLKVTLKASNPEKVKSVADDQQITVFATQVTLRKGENGDKDTTITSDYATLYKESIKDVRLAHAAGADVPFRNVKNTHCGKCDLANQNNHLMATVYEAKTFDPQDYCNYNEELDLKKLVETHYTTVSGAHAKMTAEDLEGAGLEYQFELTGLYLGSNPVSESAYAAISGSTFRPQAAAEGKQQAYGAAQDETTVGHTPLVRVKLVDKESGKVLDYGYIRLKITDGKDQNVSKEYTGAGWSYNYECQKTPWSYEIQWATIEYDFYNMLGITPEVFEAYYNADPVQASNGTYQQYKNEDGKYTALATSDFVGSVVADYTDDVKKLQWNITGTDMYKYFVTEGKDEVSAIVKYESLDNTKYPDLYVVLKTGKPITVNAPSGVANLDPNKNTNYWYTTNTSNSGLDEIHTNTLTPEDNQGGTAYEFNNRFSDVFVGNNFVAATYIKDIVDYTAGKEYDASKLTLDFKFASENNGKQYKGYGSSREVLTYTMSVTDNGKTLAATCNNRTEPVAKITGVAINDQKVELVHNASNDGFTERLLNYKAHNELADDVITAIVGLYAVNECMELPLTENTFDVRFLRPLNVFSADKTIEDANTTALQKINLKDMVSFTDWRDAWTRPTEYSNYYGITKISVDNINDGERISRNKDVLTNQSGSDWEPLQNVNDQVDFYYHAGTGATDAYLEYRNFSSTVSEFQVSIPVTIEYVWGKIYATAVVTVKRTAGNAQHR